MSHQPPHDEPPPDGDRQQVDGQPPSLRPLPPEAEALLVALVMAPSTFSRNRYFDLFEQDDARYARRRAQLVRSLVKDLTEPWPHPGREPSTPGPSQLQETTESGTVHLSYRVDEFEYRRQAILSQVEAAALHYALNRAGHGEVSDEDRRLVESALSRMDPLATD